MRNLFRYIWAGKSHSASDSKVDSLQYAEDFLKDWSTRRRAYEKAWEIRNFEIEMYWKRAGYSWALLAAAFAGYFALVSSDKSDQLGWSLYILTCLGWLLSLSFLLTNLASKKWQRNWEAHIDLLEDQFAGPLYKTVLNSGGHSVTNINVLVSVSFLFAWASLALKFLIDEDLIRIGGHPNLPILIASIATIFLSMAMSFGYGKSRMKPQELELIRRTTKLRGQ